MKIFLAISEELNLPEQEQWLRKRGFEPERVVITGDKPEFMMTVPQPKPGQPDKIAVIMTTTIWGVELPQDIATLFVLRFGHGSGEILRNLAAIENSAIGKLVQQWLDEPSPPP